MTGHHRFSVDDALSVVAAGDNEYTDGINAFITAHYSREGVAVIELTSTEEDEAERVTERFRVTAERI